MRRQPTPEQKAEERRQALKDLWQKVAAMSEEERAAFADRVGTVVTCEGHALSVGNTILLAYQADNITVVGGYNQWKAQGRQVSKGQRALGIWIPKTKAESEARTEADKPEYFIFGSVFDITQTEPAQVNS
jgi:hypothetical protein